MHGVPEFHSSGYLVFPAPQVFDLDAAPTVIDEIERLAMWSPYVVVDLSPVEFINASAVTVLLWAHRRLRALGGRLVLAGVSPTAALVVAVAGAKFTTVTSLDEIPARPDRTDPVLPDSA